MRLTCIMALTAEEALGGATAFVVKVGGDIAGRFEETREYPRLMRERTGQNVPVGFVVSAVRSSAAEHAIHALVEGEKGFNTTSHLNATADALRSGDGDRAVACFSAVQKFTRDLIIERVEGIIRKSQLLAKMDMMVRPMRLAIYEAAKVRHVGREARFLRAGEDRLFALGTGGLASVTAFGENLAEQLMAVNVRGQKLGSEGASNAYLDADLQNFDPSRAVQSSKDELAAFLQTLSRKVWVIGGARPSRMDSRGYSDVAAVDAMNAWRGFPDRVLAVAKNGPILSVDHALLPDKGRLVRGLQLNASTELFGTHGLDAGALHPDAVKALKHPCVIFNPGATEKGMTLVSDDCEVREGVLVVGLKPIPALVRVSSPDMADRHGVFGRVMEALREATLSHTYTSEGRIIVTVNNKLDVGTLDDLEGRLQADLDPSYRVRVSDNVYTMVFALGNALSGARETGLACTALANAEVKVYFQDLVMEAGVMKFVVKSEDAKKTVAVLHEVLVENAATLGS